MGGGGNDVPTANSASPGLERGAYELMVTTTAATS